MNTLPFVSTATPPGWFREAAVAGPPSPLKVNPPLPATVVIIPVEASTQRMRPFCESAMKRLSAEYSPCASFLPESGRWARDPLAFVVNWRSIPAPHWRAIGNHAYAGRQARVNCCRMAFFLNTKLQLEIVQLLKTPSAVTGSATLAFL